MLLLNRCLWFTRQSSLALSSRCRYVPVEVACILGSPRKISISGMECTSTAWSERRVRQLFCPFLGGSRSHLYMPFSMFQDFPPSSLAYTRGGRKLNKRPRNCKRLSWPLFSWWRGFEVEKCVWEASMHEITSFDAVMYVLAISENSRLCLSYA